jgi:hypothetical protein
VEYPRGRVEEALHAVTEAVALERLEAEDLFGFLAYARLYRAILLVDLGRPDAALAEVARFEEAAARRGMVAMAARLATWLRLVTLAGMERWEESSARRSTSPPATTSPRCGRSGNGNGRPGCWPAP